MPDFPPEIAPLLEARDEGSRESAWAEFVAEHTGILMAACRTLGGDHDAAMDRYAYVLEHLRRDDFRRLRQFVGDGRCKFTTWLVVIARRLCLDHHRVRFGRVRADSPDVEDQKLRRTRRDLELLVSGHEQLDHIVDQTASDPETNLLTEEQIRILELARDRLNARDRLLLRLRFTDALGAADIARLMGFPSPFHVYRRLNQLLTGLRRTLRRYGIEDPVP